MQHIGKPLGYGMDESKLVTYLVLYGVEIPVTQPLPFEDGVLGRVFYDSRLVPIVLWLFYRGIIGVWIVAPRQPYAAAGHEPVEASQAKYVFRQKFLACHD